LRGTGSARRTWTKVQLFSRLGSRVESRLVRMDTKPAVSDSGLAPKTTRESICPHCRSVLDTARGRVSANSREVRFEYWCRDCSKEFVLVR